MEQDKIVQVTDPSFRTGVSAKTGKPWNMAKIATESGKTATMFGNPQVGDYVIMKFNNEYNNWNAEPLTEQKKEALEAAGQLDRIEKKIDQLLAASGTVVLPEDGTHKVSGYEAAKAKAEEMKRTLAEKAPVEEEEVPFFDDEPFA